MIKAASLVFALITLAVPGQAEDITFKRTFLSLPNDGKDVAVELTISDSGLRIRSSASQQKDGNPVDLDVPYTAIGKISYAFTERRTVTRVALGGLLAAKSRSHWLIIAPPNGVSPVAILRLDGNKFRDVISTLNARSGKRVEVLDPNDPTLDPTAGSQDMVENVLFRADQVMAALKTAMEQYSCKIVKAEPNRIECGRGLRPKGGVGGGETVIAMLEQIGQETRVQIQTRRGLGKNWSAPVFREMRKHLETPTAP